MSIYVLEWIREDLAAYGDNLKNYRLIDIKSLMEIYKDKYIN